MSSTKRVIRRELDRLAGEILRRQAETDACILLYRRREALRLLSEAPGRTKLLDIYRWMRT